MTTTLATPSTRWSLVFVLLCLLIIIALPSGALAQSEQVQVVLFYSPFCGHCQRVIAEDLPPIIQAYNTSQIRSYFGDPPNEETGQLPAIVAFEGDVLQILYVDTTTEIGGELYLANAERFQIPPEEQVVPIMVVGDQLLIGGVEIPERLPGLVDSWLAEGGLSWPDIPGLEGVVSALTPIPDQVQDSPEAEPDGEETVLEEPGLVDPSPSVEFDAAKLTVIERIQLDPLGNSLSIVVLIGMLFSVALVGLRWRFPAPDQGSASLPNLILMLSLLGIVVAGYLSFVAASGTEAECGPVGDCHAVQASQYAYLFGSIPNGLLGLAAYLAIVGAWIVNWRLPRFADQAALALFAMAFVGTAFSAYLTFLEPFVIGATCMWCLSSAVIMTAIMLLSLNPARAAYAQRRS